MDRKRQSVPYENDEVVLYMDELTGTNVTVKPFENGDKPSARTSPVGSLNIPKMVNNNRSEDLLETDNNPGRNVPPSFGPEVDDLVPDKRREGDGNESDDRGIDDGLLPPRYPGILNPRFDVNIYQQKKTLAQGMMDLALISANANQFRYVLQSTSHPYYLASLTMIGTSLFLQIVVGIGLIWNSTYNVKKDTQVFQANKANNWTVIGIFLVTILNVFISSFGVAEPNAVVIGQLKNCDNLSEIDILKED